MAGEPNVEAQHGAQADAPGVAPLSFALELKMTVDKYLLSVVTEKDGDVVYIHANKAGLDALARSIAHLRAKLEQNECDHDHFFTEAWGGHELTQSMVVAEIESGSKLVHHVKIYAWTDEWKDKHKL